MIPVPLEIHREDGWLVLTWDDDHQGVYPAHALRMACQCAGCRDEMTGQLLLRPDSIAPDISATSVELVGGYGFQVHWSDGHHAGIYTYEYVLSLCPCERCRPGTPAAR